MLTRIIVNCPLPKMLALSVFRDRLSFENERINQCDNKLNTKDTDKTRHSEW